MKDGPEHYGHRTMTDGTHVPLTKDEAEAIWHAVEAARAKRAEVMPAARDALSAMIDAETRLRELGWWRGGGLRVRRSEECAVTEQGSTGMWRGRLDADGKYVHFGDCVASPQKCWLKPIVELTPDELAWMEECDQREAEAFEASVARAALQSEEAGK